MKDARNTEQKTEAALRAWDGMQPAPLPEDLFAAIEKRIAHLPETVPLWMNLRALAASLAALFIVNISIAALRYKSSVSDNKAHVAQPESLGWESPALYAYGE